MSGDGFVYRTHLALETNRDAWAVYVLRYHPSTKRRWALRPDDGWVEYVDGEVLPQPIVMVEGHRLIEPRWESPIRAELEAVVCAAAAVGLELDPEEMAR